jgi:hypothetical protein
VHLRRDDEVRGDRLRSLVEQLVKECCPTVPSSPKSTGAVA